MEINIITPCSRPQNLKLISESINIPKENYRWIVVFDSEEFPNKEFIPSNCESYIHKDGKSISGNAQRNFALDLVTKGYIYFNDDDTTLHPELWNEIKDLSNDFISFKQITKNGKLRLTGNTIKVNHIDSHNFLISYELLGDTRFIIDKYAADGFFAENCHKKCKNPKYIDKTLSVYNSLS